jgi:hypothetical protein
MEQEPQRKEERCAHGAQVNFEDLTTFALQSCLYVQYTYVYTLYNIGATNTEKHEKVVYLKQFSAPSLN